jgi:hypothetical protein
VPIIEAHPLLVIESGPKLSRRIQVKGPMTTSNRIAAPEENMTANMRIFGQNDSL